MKLRLPEHIPGLLNQVPVQDQPKEEEETKFWRSVAYELGEMLKVASQAEQPEICFNDMRQLGTQYIWEFYVNDLVKPKTGEINWHGQQISQWVYAGCILLQHGRVSLHH